MMMWCFVPTVPRNVTFHFPPQSSVYLTSDLETKQPTERSVGYSYNAREMTLTSEDWDLVLGLTSGLLKSVPVAHHSYPSRAGECVSVTCKAQAVGRSLYMLHAAYYIFIGPITIRTFLTVCLFPSLQLTV